MVVGWRCWWFRLLQAVRELDQLEKDKCENQEVDDNSDECTVTDNRTLLLGVYKVCSRNCCIQRQEQAVKADALCEQRHDWHDEKVDNSVHDLAECSSHDNTDCEIKGIALERKVLEFIPHRLSPLWVLKKHNSPVNCPTDGRVFMSFTAYLPEKLARLGYEGKYQSCNAEPL